MMAAYNNSIFLKKLIPSKPQFVLIYELHLGTRANLIIKMYRLCIK